MSAAEHTAAPAIPARELIANGHRSELAARLRDWARLRPTESPRLLATLEEAAAALEDVRTASEWTAQARLARVEALLDEDRKARGLKPFGRVEDQVRDALARARKAEP